MKLNEAEHRSECNLLVIGYGNTLRSDDGVGPRVAEAVDALKLPGVGVLVCQQLSPEQAHAISRTKFVVFVDAAVDTCGEIGVRQLEATGSSQLIAHAADPRTMLALARDAYGYAPNACWLTIPAVSLDFGEELSPETKGQMQKAVDYIKNLSQLAAFVTCS